jgi:hypothetical protein
MRNIILMNNVGHFRASCVRLWKEIFLQSRNFETGCRSNLSTYSMLTDSCIPEGKAAAA